MADLPHVTGFPRTGHPNRRDKLTTTAAITTAAVETPSVTTASSERESTEVMSRLYNRSTELPQLNSSGQPGCARDDTFLSMTSYPSGKSPAHALAPVRRQVKLCP